MSYYTKANTGASANVISPIRLAIVDLLLESDPQESMALSELARLRIRYNGFPGATDIQENLDRLLLEWHLTEDQLFAKTRALHSGEQIYQVKAKKYQEQEDWN